MPETNLQPATGQGKPRRKPQTLDAIIKRGVLRELRRQEGNLSRTADALGIARQTLLTYLDSWGLRVEEIRSDRSRKVWRGLPGEVRAHKALENRFSRRNPARDYVNESDYAFARRQHLYQQRGGDSELDYIREVMLHGPPTH